MEEGEHQHHHDIGEGEAVGGGEGGGEQAASTTTTHNNNGNESNGDNTKDPATTATTTDDTKGKVEEEEVTSSTTTISTTNTAITEPPHISSSSSTTATTTPVSAVEDPLLSQQPEDSTTKDADSNNIAAEKQDPTPPSSVSLSSSSSALLSSSSSNINKEDKSIQCNGLATPPPVSASSHSSTNPNNNNNNNNKSNNKDRSVLHITFMTSGSRGDVQPYLCVALALQNAGHQIVFATEERMKPFVQSFGIPYAHVSGDPTSVLFSKEGQQMLKDGKIFKMMSEMKKLQEPTYEQCLADYTKACEGADIIVSGPLCMTQAYCIAEKKNIQWTCLALGPSVPTGDFPLFMVSKTNLFFKVFNKATYSVLFWSLWKSEEKNINKWRTTVLGLPAMKGGIIDVLQKTNTTLIHAYPEFIIPGGKRPSDWNERHQLVGFVFPPDELIPLTPKLEAFVGETTGGAPIYLGFGSMPAPNPKQLLLLAAKVINNLNIRAVIVAGWSEVTEEMEREIFGEENQKVLIVPAAPHNWLLPRCSLAVHHCGIGTTAAVLRAGIPSVPCPVYLDQPYWGHRLNELGVAAKPIPFQNLTPELLTNGIKEVLSSPTMSAKAKEMAGLVVTDNGVEKAVELVLHIADIQPQFAQW